VVFDVLVGVPFDDGVQGASLIASVLGGAEGPSPPLSCGGVGGL